MKETFVLQFGGRETNGKDLKEAVKNIYTGEGHKVSDMKKVDLYVQPEVNKVYYVVNEGTDMESKGEFNL